MDYTLQGATRDRKPPALPIKQRRNSSSTSSASDVQLDWTLNLPGSSPLSSPSADVFVTPTDCNAAQCPIHHRYGSSGYHQERFFSDQTPPPIPKKKLARTLSLPAEAVVSRSPHCCENPLCIVEDSPLDCSGKDKKDKAQCFNQLTFASPDEHLPGFFSSFCHQEQVGIQNLYTDFMRNAVKHLEAMVLLEEQQVEWVRTLQPQDIVLCKDLQTEKTDSDFFMVCAPEVPKGLFAARVNTKGSASACQGPLPQHPNVEETVAHYLPCMTQENLQLSKIVATQAPSLSHEGSAEPWQESDVTTKGHTVLSFLERGLSVTLLRDFPQGTLEDFVKAGRSLHCSQPDVYERRVCLLMLQLALGLQHLESQNVDLSPKRIMLVWMQPKNSWLVDNIEDPKGVEKNRFRINSDYTESLDPLYGNIAVSGIHPLWEKWGTPRVVISCTKVQGKPVQEAPSNWNQLGALLNHCLHLYTPVHQNTTYTAGLLYLRNQLAGQNPTLQMAEIAGVLQALLWGPRAGLFEKNQPNTTVLHNWLIVKRSLLVLKFAEKGLFLKQNNFNWEEYLCLQYFALSEPETVLKTTAQLGLYNTVKLV